MCGMHTMWRVDCRLAEQVSCYVITLRGGRGVCRAEEGHEGALAACAHLVYGALAACDQVGSTWLWRRVFWRRTSGALRMRWRGAHVYTAQGSLIFGVYILVAGCRDG